MSSSSSSVLFATILVSAIGILLQVSNTNGVCCDNRGNFNCCGNGPCNFFCCNCDDGCEKGCEFDSSTAIKIGLGVASAVALLGRKRSASDLVPVATPVSEYEITLNTFNGIDLNKNHVIEFSEGLAYLQNVTKRFKRKRSVEKDDVQLFVLQFEAMDTNKDGVVEPHEFDQSLA